MKANARFSFTNSVLRGRRGGWSRETPLETRPFSGTDAVEACAGDGARLAKDTGHERVVALGARGELLRAGALAINIGAAFGHAHVEIEACGVAEAAFVRLKASPFDGASGAAAAVIAARIDSVAVNTSGQGHAITRVAIVSDALTDPSLAALTRLDTPVMVIMDLRDDGWLAGPTENMLAFLTKIGLR